MFKRTKKSIPTKLVFYTVQMEVGDIGEATVLLNPHEPEVATDFAAVLLRISK